MKQRKLSMALATLLCLSSLCMAESNQQTKQKQSVPITLVKINRGGASTRPKAPDRQVITCEYDGEQMFLTFVCSEGFATISVTDQTLLSSIYEIDTAPLEVSVTVGDLCGNINIEMETEKGNSYSGTIEISY